MSRCCPPSCCSGTVKGAGGILAVVAVLVAAEVIARAIWWIVAGTTAGVVVSLTAVVLLTRPLRRWEREAAAEIERTRPVRLAAVNGKVTPQVTATVMPPAIQNHYHVHIHGAAPEAARIIRAIPGQAGEFSIKE